LQFHIVEKLLSITLQFSSRFVMHLHKMCLGGLGVWVLHCSLLRWWSGLRKG